MMNLLKSMFKAPTPAGPPVILRAFAVTDPTINQNAARVEEDAWRVSSVDDDPSIRLFELADPGVENCILTYRSQLKTEDVKGRAYLEMWCRFPGRGEFFSKGLNHAVKGTNDWGSYETQFFLKAGQQPDLIKLNLTLEGGGTVWLKSIEVLTTPLE